MSLVYGFCTEQYSPLGGENDSLQAKVRITYIAFHQQFKKGSPETLTNITRNVPGPPTATPKRCMMVTIKDLHEGEKKKKSEERDSIAMNTISQLQETTTALQTRLDTLNNEIKHRRSVINQQQHVST
jgi:hypothetical protein